MFDNEKPSPQGSVIRLVRSLLDRDYVSTTGRVIRAVTLSTNQPGGIIQQRLTELDAEAARLAAEGKRLRPDNPVVRALMADLEPVMGRNGGRVDGIAPDLQGEALDTAGTLTRQLALPGLDDEALQALGVQWNTPDPEAVRRLIEYVDNPAWAEQLAGYSDDVLETVRNQAIRGIAEGWGPLRIAESIRQVTEGLPVHRANTLLRTLQMQSYRDGTAIHQNANTDIIRRVIRIETLDGRICMACVSLHGTVVWDSERDGGKPIPRISEHHNGRGTTISETAITPRDVQTGEDWWAGLSREQKLNLAGPGKFDALQSGRASLRDFVTTYEDSVFGEMVREASLSGVLG